MGENKAFTYRQRLAQRHYLSCSLWLKSLGKGGSSDRGHSQTFEGCIYPEKGPEGIFLWVMGTLKYFEHCNMLEESCAKKDFTFGVNGLHC